MPAPVEIRRGAAQDLDRLEPLWVSVHHVHSGSMPELAPYVDDATTWTERRKLYAELLAKPDSVLLLAAAGDALVGYGLAHVMPTGETWVPDTWVTGPRIGEIEWRVHETVLRDGRPFSHPAGDDRRPTRSRGPASRPARQPRGGTAPSSSITRAGSTGFTRWRSKPASTASCRSFSCPQPVTATSTIDAVPVSARSRRARS